MPLEREMRFGNAAASAHRTTVVPATERRRLLPAAAHPAKGKKRVAVSTGITKRGSG